MNRLRGTSDTVPQPWEHFDLIAGSGTGAIAAVMLGRLRMSIDDAISTYRELISTVYSDKKTLARSSAAYSATKLERGLKDIIRKATGDEEERMMGDHPDQAKCRVVIYAMSAHNMNANLPCAFRTYPSCAHAMPNCRIWEAIRASTAHPSLFKSIEIMDHDSGIAQPYVGGGIGYSNPTAHLLKEASVAFPDRFVASITSVGTGHTDTIRLPLPRLNLHERITPKSVLELTQTIAMDNQRVAQEMADYFLGTSGFYYRFDVEQGMQGLEPVELGREGEIASHTHAYMLDPEVDRQLNDLVRNISERPTKFKTTDINVRASASSKSPLLIFNNLPPPTYFFAGRSKEVNMICEYFTNTLITPQVFVLYGLGGAGKTQTALKAMDRIASTFEGMLFIDGSSHNTIEAALSELAISKHAGNTHGDAISWVGKREGRWLLFFDNVDDPKVSLHKYFPRSNNCSILITTRYNSFVHLANGENAECNVSEMDSIDARKLLLETCRLKQTLLSESEEKAADQLLKEFGYLALAIVLCGAYIRHTNCSISQYYKMYYMDPHEILQGDEINPLHIEDYGLSIYKTWGFSYAKVSPRSKELMGLVAFLHRNRISTEVFRRASKNFPVYSPIIPLTETQQAIHLKLRDILTMFTRQGTWIPSRLPLAMGELVSLSLVSLDSTNDCYHIHPLVQQWARKMSPGMAECTAALLAMSIDRDLSTESYAFRRGLVPHIKEILGFCSFMNLNDSDSKLLLDTTMHCGSIVSINNVWQFVEAYSDAEQPNQMEKLEQLVYQSCKLQLGEHHPQTLECMRYLAGTHRSRGNLDESERLHREVLEVRRQTLGDDNPDTLRSMSGLAETYYEQFRYTDAEPIFKEAFTRWERIHGKAHPNTLKVGADLAATYQALGQLKEAEELGASILATRRAVQGKDHPETLQSMAYLATTYEKQGLLDEAENLGTQALELRKTTLGDEHPSTQRSKAFLAMVFFRRGRLLDAERFQLEVLEFRRKLLGLEHPETLRSMADLAATYNQQDRLDEAEAIEIETLATRKRLFGDENLETLETMANLGALYHKQGRFEEAERLGTRVLLARNRLLGDEHPDTLRSMINLAATYCHQSQPQREEAERLFSSVVEVRKRTLGDSHQDTLSSIAHLQYVRGLGGPNRRSKAETGEPSSRPKRVFFKKFLAGFLD